MNCILKRSATICFATAFGLVLPVFGLGGNVLRGDDNVRFNRDVRPILSEYCFSCHGPDKNHREADLRLDTSDGLEGEIEGKKVVVPGSPDLSLVIQRILSEDPDKRMPPPSSGKRVSQEEANVLRRWIEQGARYEGHWAFQPVANPSLPTQAIGSLPIGNEIDRFLNSVIASQKVKVAEHANRIALIRRLSFDLTGLPPSVEEVEAFEKDSRPDAYVHLVDRLLASEHFGERMAVWWLDLVRYADTVGYHGDQNMSVSPFRDYVIRSFNENKRFDIFTIEQLAGDLLPEPTREQQVAAGYNRLGMMSAEGGVQDKEYLAKYAAERVRNVGGTWLGATLGCCECHDHKYDPFLTRDFYRLEAFFADIEEKGLYSGANASGEWGPSIKVPSKEQEDALKRLDDQIAKLKANLAAPSTELEEDQKAWESQLPLWTIVKPSSIRSNSGATLEMQPDGTILASGELADKDTYTLEISGLGDAITGFRIEALPHDNLPKKGPGRADNGNFVITEFRFQEQKQVEVGSEDPASKEEPTWEAIPFHAATATFEQPDAGQRNPYKKYSAAAAIDQDAKGQDWGWAVMGREGSRSDAIFALKEPHSMKGERKWRLVIEQNHGKGHHTLGRFRVSVTTKGAPQAIADATSQLLNALEIPLVDRSVSDRTTVSDYYRSIAPRLAPQRSELAKLETAQKTLQASIPSMLATKVVKPRVIRVLARGNWMDDQGEEVLPGFPSVLSDPEFKAPSSVDRLNRLDLARWILSPNHPLTSRVLVNRLWKQFYGAGLTRRLDDFGSQGEAPSHPELLDWLARRMVETGWDIKSMVKLMVTSEAYQRSSDVSAEDWKQDPTNRTFARQLRYRLDAEFVRDTSLAVSGLLNRRVGGVSVRPYQPPGYWAYLNFPQREWENSPGEDRFRRGLYTHWQRQYLYPSLMTFDAPSREECTADRMRSNTPLQSLVLLNDPAYVESARGLGLLTLRAGSDDEGRLQWMAKRVLSRKFSESEGKVLSALLTEHRKGFAADQEATKKFLQIGSLPVPPDVDPVELAAWTSVARVMFNLHESITRP